MTGTTLGFKNAPMEPSFSIIDNNGVLLQQQGDDSFPLYSITKTIIAALTVDMGVKITRPVADWLDETWVSQGRDISVGQLLTHTSGLRDYFSVSDYRAAADAGGTPWSDRRYADHTLMPPLLFEPGHGWAYSNPGFWSLKRICEIESGSSFASLVEERISNRLDLPSLTVAGGIFSDQLPAYEAGWVWHGLVCGTAEDTAHFMASPLVAPLAESMVSVPNAGPTYPDAAYGLGVMGDMSGTNYGHNGSGPGFSTSCFHFPGSGITISYFMPSDGSDDAAYRGMVALAAQNNTI